MNNFKELVSLCKASVSISVNEHKDTYQKLEHYLFEITKPEDDIPKEVLDEMLKRDTIVEVRAYPDSPVGFIQVYHYDIDAAIDSVLKLIKE